MSEPDPLPEHVPEPDQPEEGQDQPPTPGFPTLARGMALFAPRTAEEAARAAEADRTNVPGYCLQTTRQWAGIDSMYGSASVAWSHAERRQTSRRGRRGAFAFWIGGSKGYGHIGMMLSDEADPWVRSADAGGRGIVATRRLSWFDANWPSLMYVGWADNVNGVTVPGVMGDGFEMADLDDLRRIVREELERDEFVRKVGDEVWRREFRATNANGVTVIKAAREFLTGTWETVKDRLPPTS